MALHKWRVRCLTDSKYVYEWLSDTDPAPTTCHEDRVGHSIETDPTPVVVEIAATTPTSIDGIPLVQPQVQTINWQICDRDIKLTTCTVDSAAAVEDVKINMTTLLEDNWDECTLVNVYKLNGTQDAMEPCTDQTDADANGVLSVWDYCAKNQNADPKTQISYDIRDGGLIVDPDLLPLTLERYDHRAYAIGAPDLSSMQSHVRFFDGYLAAQPDGRIEAKSPQAKRMDISQTSLAGVIRIYIKHPAGAKRKHILRLVTYRDLGTF